MFYTVCGKAGVTRHRPPQPPAHDCARRPAEKAAPHGYPRPHCPPRLAVIARGGADRRCGTAPSPRPPATRAVRTPCGILRHAWTFAPSDRLPSPPVWCSPKVGQVEVLPSGGGGDREEGAGREEREPCKRTGLRPSRSAGVCRGRDERADRRRDRPRTPPRPHDRVALAQAGWGPAQWARRGAAAAHAWSARTRASWSSGGRGHSAVRVGGGARGWGARPITS
jgi:hypothetical protein